MRSSPPKSEHIDDEKALLALAALAQSTRLHAFRILVHHEPDGLTAGELARELEVPQNTLSAHFNVLSRAELVTSERHGRSIIYRASLNQFRKVVLFLIRDCCGSRPEVCAPVLEILQSCDPPGRRVRGRV